MKRVLFISISLLTFVACSHKVISNTSTTNSDAAAIKPKVDANAMYLTDIKPVLEKKCSPCHFPAQGGNKAPFDNYASVSNQVSAMLERVQLKPNERGYMPFMGKKEALTETEIASLKSWKESLGK